jgi:hypothetical protein
MGKVSWAKGIKTSTVDWAPPSESYTLPSLVENTITNYILLD